MSCFSKLVFAISFYWDFGNSALQGAVGIDVDCGYSVQASMNQNENLAFRTFIHPKSDVTFSLCASTPSNINTKLTLYDWTLDPVDATKIDDCDSLTSGAGSGCDACGSQSYLETWTITLDSDFYYIEIYAYAFLNYHLAVSCTAVPTTATPSSSPITLQPTSSPVTEQPTTAVPTTSAPTSSPVTNEPTTTSPTTAVPTTSEPTNSPITNEPTTSAPPTFVPTNTPTEKPSNIPTNAPISGESGEAHLQSTFNTGALMGNDGNESGMATVTLLLIIVVVLGVIVLIGALGCCVCYIQKRNKQTVLQKAEKEIEIGNIVASNGTINGPKGNTTQGADSSNNTIVRVVSVSMSAGENVTGTTGMEDEDTGTDNEMYGSEEELNVTAGSPGNEVDFMDNAEGDILNEENGMDEMYEKGNKNNKTAGMQNEDEDEIYAKPDQETAK